MHKFFPSSDGCVVFHAVCLLNCSMLPVVLVPDVVNNSQAYICQEISWVWHDQATPLLMTGARDTTPVVDHRVNSQCNRIKFTTGMYLLGNL